MDYLISEYPRPAAVAQGDERGPGHREALESPGDDLGRWPVTTGFVTDALAPHLDELTEADIYLAGPPPMGDAVVARLRGLEVRLDRIHYDRFG